MTNYREILRLYSQGLSIRSISASLSCSRNTASKVIKQAEKLDFKWSLSDKMDNQQIGKLLFPLKSSGSNYQEPDYDYIHKELAKSGVTLSLLWHEYSELCQVENSLPYKYSQFCYLYHNYAKKTKATMRIKRKPGEKLEVDWAGQTAFIKDNITGESIRSYVFVATLPYSGYSYVEAFLTMAMESWILAHINCFAFFKGVARILVPDNLKTGVDKVRKHNPIINKTYNEMACHYDTAVIPARVRHPKDKASAECTVGIISTWIIAALRNQTFFSIEELNQAIKTKLFEFNSKPFQKKDGSRESIFKTEEQDMLLPLPPQSYELSSWLKSTVPFNYHITVHRMYYSVPYEYIGYVVDVRVTSRIIEIFYKDLRIASHVRISGKSGQYQTNPEHMPQKHQQFQQWNSESIIARSKQIGEHTEIVIRSILSACRVEQQGFRSCMSLLKATDKYSIQRLENACRRALSYSPNPGYKSVLTILKTGSDKLNSLPEKEESRQSNDFEITRGSEYYERRTDD